MQEKGREGNGWQREGKGEEKTEGEEDVKGGNKRGKWKAEKWKGRKNGRS